MSSRPKRARTTKSYKEDESDDEQGDEYQPEGASEVEEDKVEPEPSTPRRRKSTASPKKKAPAKSSTNKPRRKKAGSLEGVLQLPPELQDLILSLVTPEILVLLLQVRHFRERLASPGSVQIWTNVRINAGMPELQAKDITERQYLTLVFDKHCHDCGTPGVHSDNLDLWARTRLCTECRHNWKLYDRRKYQTIVKKLHPEAEKCAKDHNSGGVPLPRGIRKISEKLRRMPPEEVKSYVTERQALKGKIDIDARAIRKWFEDRNNKEFEKIKDVPKIRREQIHEKLLEEGWTDETLPWGWDRESQVNHWTMLTKAAWTKIKGPLQESLRRTICWRRKDDRVNAVKNAYFTLLHSKGDPPLFPSFSKFSEFPSIKSLLEIPEVERPELEPFLAFDKVKWDVALPSTEPLVAEYEQAMRDLAIRRLTDAYNARGLPTPDNPISAPLSFFRYFQGEPPGDWNPIPEQVARFPEIHAIMRDRQTGKNVVQMGFNYAAAEFETVEMLGGSGSSYGRGFGRGSLNEWLDVDLDHEERA